MSNNIREGYVKKGGLKPEPQGNRKPDSYSPPPQPPRGDCGQGSTGSRRKEVRK